MIWAAALLAYAGLAATLGSRWLRGAEWPRRAPALGLGICLALSVSVVLSVVLAGATVAVPRSLLGDGLAELLQACVWTLRAQYGPVTGPLLGLAGVAVAMLVAARALVALAWEWHAVRRQRRHHRELLRPLGRLDPRLGALVVPHRAAAAYCLPGCGRGQVVLTAGALEVLSAEQLAGVLAHERAHLRGCHHLLVTAAVALGRAFPWLPLFRRAADQVPQLVEMLADDAALDHGDRRTYAAALVALAGSAAPARTLAAGGTAALARIHRILTPGTPLRRWRRLVAWAAAVALVGLPVVVAVAPALAVMQSPYCPVDISQLR